MSIVSTKINILNCKGGFVEPSNLLIYELKFRLKLYLSFINLFVAHEDWWLFTEYVLFWNSMFPKFFRCGLAVSHWLCPCLSEFQYLMLLCFCLAGPISILLPSSTGIPRLLWPLCKLKYYWALAVSTQLCTPCCLPEEWRVVGETFKCAPLWRTSVTVNTLPLSSEKRWVITHSCTTRTIGTVTLISDHYASSLYRTVYGTAGKARSQCDRTRVKQGCIDWIQVDGLMGASVFREFP